MTQEKFLRCVDYIWYAALAAVVVAVSAALGAAFARNHIGAYNLVDTAVPSVLGEFLA